jgi:FkbM family methyltransferase
VAILKTTVNAILKPVGLEISRAKQRRSRETFYKPSETCQISNLATIYERVFGQLNSGFFVEVGAFDGESYSNSSCLADRGWSGILIEPIPDYAKLASRRHSKNPQVKIVQSAVGDHDGIAQINVASALSTINPEMLSQYKDIDWAADRAARSHVISVPIRKLDNILTDEHVPVGFNVLVVDTEGFEASVMAGLSLDKWRPTMIIIELGEYHPDFDRRREDGPISEHIQKANYEIIFKDDINTVFLAKC